MNLNLVYIISTKGTTIITTITEETMKIGQIMKTGVIITKTMTKVEMMTMTMAVVEEEKEISEVETVKEEAEVVKAEDVVENKPEMIMEVKRRQKNKVIMAMSLM